MSFEITPLPYDRSALEPHISAETLDYHYGKHHQAYVDKLNQLADGSPWQGRTLEDIIREAEGGIFNNGAQVWNHTFYWSCLSPGGGGEPPRHLAGRLETAFGSVEQFKNQFTSAAAGHFGSGWAWLVQRPEGELAVLSTANADNPLRGGATPLLTCDVWEHAYYIDYRNARPKYLESFWNIVNWELVARNLTD